MWTQRRGEGSLTPPGQNQSYLVVLGSDPTSPPGDGSSNTYQGARWVAGMFFVSDKVVGGSTNCMLRDSWVAVDCGCCKTRVGQNQPEVCNRTAAAEREDVDRTFYHRHRLCTAPPCRYESGLDNSPMYELWNSTDVNFDTTTHHMGIYDVGMTALYLSDTQALIQLAEVAGRYEMIPALQERYALVQQAMNDYMWSNGTNMYTNVLFNGTQHERYSPTSFFPLISGSASDAQAEAMMGYLTSPLGFCLNTSFWPNANASMLVQWYDGQDNAGCETDACTIDRLDSQYNFIRVEATALLPSAGPAPGLIPLNLWYSPVYGDNALTTNTTSQGGPDSTYIFVRQEGWCAQSIPENTWPITTLSLHYSESRKDYQTCGSPACLKDTSTGYVKVADLCYAYNATGPSNLPCKIGVPSIAREDPAFYDNNYWRGRAWAPHYMLTYWGLRQYDHVPAVRAARLELVSMGKALALQNWLLFRQVAENVNGQIGIAEDVGSADPFYHWGALFGFLSFLEDGAY